MLWHDHLLNSCFFHFAVIIVVACSIRYPLYGKHRHTHQSAILQTIIYNAICNLFIDPVLVCSEVQTFYMNRLYIYLCIKAYRSMFFNA